MTYNSQDTICAIGTAPGGAARGMLRVSGPSAISVVARTFEAHERTSLHSIKSPTALSGSAHIRLHGEAQNEIPCELFLWPGERSYTREPVAEIHSFGSPPLLEALTAAVCQAGARLAEPGEFTLRAFLAGRIDLTQAEAVLGVIDAHSDTERDTALAQLAGGLAKPLQDLREQLLQLLAELEAGLDFVEEDITFLSADETSSRLAEAGTKLANMAEQMTSRSMSESVPRVALIGAPNAGKSSLFNAIAVRYSARSDLKERLSTPAIVSAQRGTTRDYLTAVLDFAGLKCELVDTAGIDEQLQHITPNELAQVDTASQKVAGERSAGAAIRLFCVDSTDASAALEAERFIDRGCNVLVLTKIDLLGDNTRSFDSDDCIATSSNTGQGIDDLCERVRTLLGRDASLNYNLVVGTTADRCRESIRLAATSLARAGRIAGERAGDELVAAEIRIALGELGKVVGVVYTDDLLDRIFSTFCIGK